MPFFKKIIWSFMVVTFTLSTFFINTSSQAANCELPFYKTKLCASLKWLQGSRPIVSKNSPFELKFQGMEGDNSNLENFDLTAKLWMPTMNHGSSPVKIEKLDAQTFLVKNVYFIMDGPWQIIFQLKRQGVVIDTLSLDLTL